MRRRPSNDEASFLSLILHFYVCAAAVAAAAVIDAAVGR